MEIKNIETETDYHNLIESSFDRPVFLLKHSTACWISAEVKKQFDQFINNNDQVFSAIILVIENRALSQMIASESAIAHQSPQVILFREGRAVWNRSQMEINQTEMEKILSNN